MPQIQTVPTETLEQLRNLDTCTVSNAIEHFNVRTRNEGYMNGSIRCIFPDLPPVVGYAVTGCIRTSSTPVAGRCYYDRVDWWSYVQTIPGPRILVIQDVDHMPGVGALFGEVHASIASALNCVAYVTNGSVRDLPGVRSTGLQLFAHSIAVSHAYAHIVEFGEPVKIAGLTVRPGDLLHGDQHGILCIPRQIAPQIPKTARDLVDSEEDLIRFCRSSEFTPERLNEFIERAASASGVPDRDPRA